MKRLTHFTFSILLLAFFSCNSSGQTDAKNVQSPLVDSSSLEPENTGNKINFDKTKVIKVVYVIDRRGAEMKQQASQGSKTIGNYEFGTKLDVIEETEEWFGVRDRITREFLRNGSKIESTGWEKVYVLKKNTGSIDKITLVPADLNIISSLTVDQKLENFETARELKDFVKIELIDESLFTLKRSSALNFLTADTAETKKEKGIIKLKCQKGAKKYVDKPDAEESSQVFQYVGQIEFLNKYLIGGSYYEGLDYRLIDKTSGEETQTFGEYPNISADKTHIICIYSNPYNLTADLELYSIEDKRIKHRMSASFKNWMPTVDPGEMFWSADGYLYLTANHVNSFWKESGHLNDKCQHIRIKVL